MAQKSASSDSSLYCIICNSHSGPKRVYFRNVTKEPLFSLKQLLTKHHSEERVLNCLKEPVVSCKGTCQALIRNLSKVKLRLESLENEIVVKIRFENEDETNTTTEGPASQEELQQEFISVRQLKKPFLVHWQSTSLVFW